MIQPKRTFATILVGCGPAGLAVLLSAHRDGRLRQLLQEGLLIVERNAALGCGHIGDYVINSDSTGNTFLDPLRRATEPALLSILQTEVARRCAAAGDGPVPLGDVGELLKLVGDAMRSIIEGYARSQVMTSCDARCARALPGAGWIVDVRDAFGRTHHFQTPHLVLATGAGQPHDRLQKEGVAGVPVTERWQPRLMQSGEVLSRGGLLKVADRLRGQSAPRVAILGGSTSAVAVASALLHRLPRVSFQPGGITLFHRRPLKVYYTSRAEALADGYNDFGPNDVCRVTNRVYRFAGLRLDSKELLMQLYGLGKRNPEPRVNTHLLKNPDAEAVERIDAADLVIAAFGYRPNALPLIGSDGRRIALLADAGPSRALVNQECRVLDDQGMPIDGVFGIGLAAGFEPPSQFGGEASFSGQVNGLWLWQNGVGSIITNAILANVARGSRLVQTTPVRDHGPGHYALQGLAS